MFKMLRKFELAQSTQDSPPSEAPSPAFSQAEQEKRRNMLGQHSVNVITCTVGTSTKRTSARWHLDGTDRVIDLLDEFTKMENSTAAE